jgi:hypothetical protein
MRQGISLWYDWQTDTIRFTTKALRSKPRDWLDGGSANAMDNPARRGR